MKRMAQLDRVDSYLAELIHRPNTLLGKVIPDQAMQQRVPAFISQIQQEILEVRAFNHP